MNSILTVLTLSTPIVAPTKNLYASFCLLNNISKDAEFQALSEYIIASVITFVYSHNMLKKLKNKKYPRDEFDDDSAFLFFIR
jgi:hypothetical protein